MLNHDEMKAIACTAAKLRLGRLFDGELDDEESGQVAEHLLQCRDCIRDLEELRALDGMLNAGLPEYSIRSGVAAAITRGRTPGWWLSAAAVIPLALGAVAGGMLSNGHAEPRPEGTATASMIEESFGPGSLRGIDDLARDLEPRAEEER